MTTYFAIIHQDGNSAFGAYFPDLPGCFAAGDTMDEALDNLRVSLRLYAEDLIEDGKEIARPRQLEALKRDTDAAESLAAGGLLVMVPLLFADKKRRVNITLEPSLIAAVDEAARITGTSRSEYLANAAWHEVRTATGAVRVKKAAASMKGKHSARRAAAKKDKHRETA